MFVIDDCDGNMMTMMMHTWFGTH